MKKISISLALALALSGCVVNAPVQIESKSTCDTPKYSMNISSIKSSKDDIKAGDVDAKQVILDTLKESYCFVINGEKLQNHYVADISYETSINAKDTKRDGSNENLEKSKLTTLQVVVTANLKNDKSTINQKGISTKNITTIEFLGIGQEAKIDGEEKISLLKAATQSMINGIISK